MANTRLSKKQESRLSRVTSRGVTEAELEPESNPVYRRLRTIVGKRSAALPRLRDRIRLGEIWLTFNGLCEIGVWDVSALAVRGKKPRHWYHLGHSSQNPVTLEDLKCLQAALEKIIPILEANKKSSEEGRARMIAEIDSLPPGPRSFGHESLRMLLEAKDRLATASLEEEAEADRNGCWDCGERLNTYAEHTCKGVG